MITNFEQLTQDLTKEEKRILPILIDGFNKHVGKDRAIKSDVIVEAIDCNREKYGLTKKFSGVRLRKLCNFIRSAGVLPLIATSEGYYISNDNADLEKQILSLQQRADAILSAKNGLLKFIKH